MNVPMKRPNKYLPEHCDMLIEHGKKGLSLVSFCAVINVGRDTLWRWFREVPEFREAKKLYEAHCQYFWEQKGIEGLFNEKIYDDEGKLISQKSMNAPVWIFNMKNRFKWSDKNIDEEIQDEVTKIRSEEQARELLKKAREEKKGK